MLIVKIVYRLKSHLQQELTKYHRGRFLKKTSTMLSLILLESRVTCNPITFSGFGSLTTFFWYGRKQRRIKIERISCFREWLRSGFKASSIFTSECRFSLKGPVGTPSFASVKRPTCVCYLELIGLVSPKSGLLDPIVG